MHHKLTVLDLFSGIGGFSLGLESTGYFETIAFVEKDKYCQKVLTKNFKDVPIEGDIRNVKGNRYEADVVTGGFPCQPFSTAGKRKGTDDDRYLWDETIRVIRECKPKWFIGENVEGIINIQNGMVLGQVQDDLEDEGFEVRCFVIPASGIGAWHQRKRVWIIGHNVSNSDKSRSFKEHSATINRQDKRDGSINEGSGRSNEKESKQTWWQTQSKICGVPDGVSYELDKNRSKRIKALGNSIVPQIVYEIGKAIIQGEKNGTA